MLFYLDVAAGTAGVIILLAAILNIQKRGWRAYVVGVLIGLDQFANAIIGGSPDETISSRCARGQHCWYWRLLGGVLNAINPGHIEQALANEKAGAQLPAQLRPR